ncbi:hypothetical protein [Franconibacter pulveris]|uniref:hypothetical protein n=1 Tax=Franconibacter pulveris TaxID=435910 RepID=UPI00128ECC13|nr:hypothetical protein [Franconibacter pulveris]
MTGLAVSMTGVIIALLPVCLLDKLIRQAPSFSLIIADLAKVFAQFANSAASSGAVKLMPNVIVRG